MLSHRTALWLKERQDIYWGFPCGSPVKNLPASARNRGLTPGSERSPREGNGNPPQYSCLGNPVDRETWQATVCGVTKESDRQKVGLNNNIHTHTHTHTHTHLLWGFPGCASGKEPACQCRRHKRCEFHPWVRKIPWRRERQPTPLFLPREFHGQRSLAGYRVEHN